MTHSICKIPTNAISCVSRLLAAKAVNYVPETSDSSMRIFGVLAQIFHKVICGNRQVEPKCYQGEKIRELQLIVQ